MATMAVTLPRVTVAPRETKCRNCWTPIRRGDPVHVESRGPIVFHVECEPAETEFPIIGGYRPVPGVDGVADNPYAHRRFYRSHRR